MTPPVIECAPEGPYLVKNLDRLVNARGERLATKPVTALCRCGRSSTKPYCDGTHKKAGFSSARDAGVGAPRASYTGRRLTIHDDREICAHAGYCTEGLRTVFVSGREPWIDPDGAAVERVIAVIEQCPSGALSYSLDGVGHRDQARGPSIAVTENGPYAVVGGARLVGADVKRGASTEHFTLCRCGASKNKPFCDGSHWDIGFKDDAG